MCIERRTAAPPIAVRDGSAFPKRDPMIQPRPHRDGGSAFIAVGTRKRQRLWAGRAKPFLKAGRPSRRRQLIWTPVMAYNPRRASRGNAGGTSNILSPSGAGDSYEVTLTHGWVSPWAQ